MRYAYEIGTAAKIADEILLGVLAAVRDGRCNKYDVLFENCLLYAGIDISDGCDSRLCSQAMQILKRRGECRYSRRRRTWEFYNWETVVESFNAGDLVEVVQSGLQVQGSVGESPAVPVGSILVVDGISLDRGAPVGWACGWVLKSPDGGCFTRRAIFKPGALRKVASGEVYTEKA